MRALLVIPAALLLGAAADPCTLELPRGQLPRPGATWYQLQLLNQQLNLAACVAAHTPPGLRAGSLPRIREKVRAACVGDAAASGTMTEDQAAALSDRLVDQDVAQLTRCHFAPLPPISPEANRSWPLN